MAAQNQGASMDLFEAYFRRADVDGDGRISGAEAVAFFQGSNLSKQVLAQIWMHADQSHTGFLGRPEFYNALRLVTVAQSKRELTPDIVKAALYGPAAAKIPAPQINLPIPPAHQLNPVSSASTPQMGAVAQTASQNHLFRGPGVQNATITQQYFPSHQNQTMRPLQHMPAATAPRPPQTFAGQDFSSGGGMAGQTQSMPVRTTSRPAQTMPSGGLVAPNQNMSSDWLGGKTGGAPTGAKAVVPSTPVVTSNLQTSILSSSQLESSGPKALIPSGNGIASNSTFGGDVFSAAFSTPKQVPAPTSTNGATLSAVVPVSSSPQPSVNPRSNDSLQSSFSMQPTGDQLQRKQSSLNPGQIVSATSSLFTSSGISVGAGTPASSQLPLPKMKPSDVQKYSKVFMEVDSDRDGKITGEQARNLFLSWRLPREVLKQVWDLSDQDNDSMLSLREFCFALYLMERYREGRPLPAALPSNIMYDETLLSMTGQPPVAYGNAMWGGSTPGFGQQPGLGTQPVTSATGVRPPIAGNVPRTDDVMIPNQQKTSAPLLDDSFGNQLDNGEQNAANAKLPEVNEKDKFILDSKEKIEFYRTKMQELVLYKSRCDNRLNEITERAIADKREAESLAKKYEEKYKQVAEIASKLTVEEARFRDIQERKSELHQAIVKMEQGGSADGILQVRADRIQSDLEELMKALIERCKKHKLDLKSTAIIELPFGWEPGIQEGAAVWNEEWDKFEDEGFGNELNVDVKNVPGSSKPTSSSLQTEKASDGSLTPSSLSKVDGKHGNVLSSDRALESESSHTHSEDEFGRSPRGNPAGRNSLESPSQEFSNVHFEKNSEADAEIHRSFDESIWGSFDNNDDTDSVWGFNPVDNKDSDSEKHKDFFGSSDLGVSSVRTGSPSAESAIFQKKSPFFEDSVPSTPHSRFGNSPPRYSDSSGYQFDSFSRFDSFSMHDAGFSQPERLTRFDSINSSRDFGQPERLTRFDSINSTKDFGRGFTSFDDSDPFGSTGPFKVSSDNQTPKRSSDNWSAF